MSFLMQKDQDVKSKATAAPAVAFSAAPAATAKAAVKADAKAGSKATIKVNLEDEYGVMHSDVQVTVDGMGRLVDAFCGKCTGMNAWCCRAAYDNRGDLKQMRPLVTYTGQEPQLLNKTEEEFQRERVSKFGRYGLSFNALITVWQGTSWDIRHFFLDGKMEDLVYEEHLMPVGKSGALVMQSNDKKDHYGQLVDLTAFWNVMNNLNGARLDTFAQDTVLYRGVKKSPGYLASPGTLVNNVLSNWTSSAQVATKFANGPEGAYYMATFPKGTRYFYTGQAQGEFEYIIPGGTFQLAQEPKLVAFDTESGQTEAVYLYRFTYAPGNQSFPWPGNSPSAPVRDAYQKDLVELVLPDVIEHYLSVKNSTLQQIVKAFYEYTQRLGVVGFKTIWDYPTQFKIRIDSQLTGPAAAALWKEYNTLRPPPATLKANGPVGMDLKSGGHSQPRFAAQQHFF